MEQNTNVKTRHRLFEGYSFDGKTILLILLLLFVVGAVSGWFYEMGFYRIDQGQFVKRGHGVGPWLPIYGFGSLFILLTTARLKKYPLAVFSVAGLVSGALEFATGWALYHFWDGLRLWDYNTEIWNWGNIGGYVCIRSVLFFACAGLLLVYGIAPLICRLAERLPKWAMTALTGVLFGLFLVDFIIGYILKPL